MTRRLLSLFHGGHLRTLVCGLCSKSDLIGFYTVVLIFVGVGFRAWGLGLGFRVYGGVYITTRYVDLGSGM